MRLTTEELNILIEAVFVQRAVYLKTGNEGAFTTCHQLWDRLKTQKRLNELRQKRRANKQREDLWAEHERLAKEVAEERLRQLDAKNEA